MTRRQIAAFGLLILCAAAGSLAGKKDKEKANIRSVEGVVADGNGNPIAGAIVQLKNNKTLQVRSFVALQDGTLLLPRPKHKRGLRAESLLERLTLRRRRR